MPTLSDRFKNAWNAFTSRDPTKTKIDFGPSYYSRPDRTKLSIRNDRTIITAIYNIISIDVSAIPIRHVIVDKQGQYLDDVESGLQECLTFRANRDQTARAFIQDIVLSMFDEGCIAVVPTETRGNPFEGSYEILSLRTAKIVQWYPKHVRVQVYNEATGRREERVYPKSLVSIHENPFFNVMNEPNSTLQRLLHKLSQSDKLDENITSSKLDLIVQLPYVAKGELTKKRAATRKKEIEAQLIDSKYGIAYTDGTEKIIQLNRPVENNMQSQIEYLTSTLYGQLGITDTILNGTADEKTMLNYYNRTVEPVLAAITQPMMCSFISPNAKTRGQRIKYFRDPFRLAPLIDIASIADVFERNEIMSSNEFRQVLGMHPSDDPRADMLVNSNMPQDETVPTPQVPGDGNTEEEEYNPMMTPVSEIM